MSTNTKRGYYKRVGNKTYGPYWYPRGTHYWTVKDLERVAKHLHTEHKISAFEILAAIAVAVGLSTLFCRIAKSLTATLSIINALREVSVTLGLSMLITVVLEFLLQIKLVAPSWLKLVVALAIAAIVVLQRISDAVNTLLGDLNLVTETVGYVDELCKEVQKKIGNAALTGCEVIAGDDACYHANQAIKEAAFALKSDIDKAQIIFNESLFDQLIHLIQNDIHDPDSWSSLDWN